MFGGEEGGGLMGGRVEEGEREGKGEWRKRRDET